MRPGKPRRFPHRAISRDAAREDAPAPRASGPGIVTEPLPATEPADRPTQQAATATDQPDALESARLEALRRELDEARARRDRMREERDEALEQTRALRAELEAARQERERAIADARAAERDQAARPRSRGARRGGRGA